MANQNESATGLTREEKEALNREGWEGDSEGGGSGCYRDGKWS